MIAIFLITALLIVLYLAYPLWLWACGSLQPEEEIPGPEIQGVSLILLSYNGNQYLERKIEFILDELSGFQSYELIIIDDNSSDGSKEIIEEFRGRRNIKIVLKSERRGIPHSMNLGVALAAYRYIVFCDQRQKLSPRIIRKIVEPLRISSVGAVSSCITQCDKRNKLSIFRKHENLIKSIESKSGCLIGVYGPLYAVRKECYMVIPEHIILDDLFLSLKILRTKHIKLIDDCRIFDDSFSHLYNYRRTRRYLLGLMQILREESLLSNLRNKQLIMLLWHKYLRLLIPPFLVISYLGTGICSISAIGYLPVFVFLTITLLLSFLPPVFTFQFILKNLVRFSLFYFIAIPDILFISIFNRSASLKKQQSGRAFGILKATD